MDSLFSFAYEQKKPLADRMRPEKLSDFVGQERAVGSGSPLRRMIERDMLQSVLFYGPPGTGKTTLATVIANVTGNQFVSINAVSSGVPELRKLISKAQELQRSGMGRTIVFIDEIHRFNKAQQDVLLPYVENGTIAYDYGFRDYSPNNARFTTIDPIRDGSNWFSYVVNDPVNYVDPLGLSTSDRGSSPKFNSGMFGQNVGGNFSTSNGWVIGNGFAIPQSGATLDGFTKASGVPWSMTSWDQSRNPKSLQVGETIFWNPNLPFSDFTLSSKQPNITLDAGHGGSDYGSKGFKSLEKNINLSITKNIEKQLSANGYNINMTRENDSYVSLESRYSIANDNNSSIFISIHTNSSNPFKSGFNIIIPDDTSNSRFKSLERQENSQKLAEAIYKSLLGAGIKPGPDGIYTDVRGLAVLRGTDMPAVLIEVGYIISDSKYLSDDMYLDKLSSAIVNGVKEYFKGK